MKPERLQTWARQEFPPHFAQQDRLRLASGRPGVDALESVQRYSRGRLIVWQSHAEQHQSEGPFAQAA